MISRHKSAWTRPDRVSFATRVQVTLADQQADPNSPLYSAKTFEELGLSVLCMMKHDFTPLRGLWRAGTMIFSRAFTTWASQNHPRFRSAHCPFYLPIREYSSSFVCIISVSRGASSCQIVLCFLLDVGHIDSPVARCRARTGARIRLTRRSTTREFIEVCIVPYGKCLHSRASRLHVPETGALSCPASCFGHNP